jgi:SAM-dependent methyltransferase
MTWDERFASPDYAPQKPMDFLVDLAQRLPAGRMLDLACGAGRHAALFATHGWQVTAVDSSPAALSRAAGPGVTTMLGDLTTMELPQGTWDLTVVTLYTDRDLFARLPGKRVAIATLLGDSQYALERGELRRCFQNGWEIEHYRETSAAPPARSVAELVARRM